MVKFTTRIRGSTDLVGPKRWKISPDRDAHRGSKWKVLDPKGKRKAFVKDNGEMIDVDRHWEHLEELSEADQLRTIQIVPKVPPDDLTPDFVEYMQVAHHDEFAEKFSLVLLAMMHFHPQSIVYVDSDDKEFYERHPGLARDLDVHGFDLEKLESYIRAVVGGREARMVFHFTSSDILVRFTGGLDNDIYGEDPQFDDMLSRLVTSQGLFLETYENIWAAKQNET